MCGDQYKNIVRTLLLAVLFLTAIFSSISPVLAQDAPFSVDGYVYDTHGQPVADVIVTFSGGFGTAQTNANGFYTKSGLSGRVFIEPQKDGWEFNSTSLWGLPGQHYANVNFDGFTTRQTPQTPQTPQLPLTYALSGRVTTQTGQGVPDVTIYILEGHTAVTDMPETAGSKYPPTRTDSNGNWSLSGLSGSVTIIPRKLSWTFVSPYMLAGNDSSMMNFVATEVTAAPGSPPATTGNSVIQVHLDGKTLEFDQPPLIVDGRTLVPFRSIFEALGASVKYIADTKTVIANKTVTTITLKIGSTKTQVDDRTVELDVTARVVNGRTMVPLRFVGEAMGSEVTWNGATRTISINTAKKTGFDVPTEFKPEDIIYREFKWRYNNANWTWNFGAAKVQYEYYKSLKRLNTDDYSLYATSPYDDNFISGFINSVKATKAQYNFSDRQLIDYLVAFVQSLPYVPDDVSTGFDEYPKYPVETLIENGGDCEDTSILMVTLLRELGYGAVLLGLPGHMAVGVKGSDNLPGSYYTYEGSKYFYLETTGEGWTIGDIPPAHKNQSATLYFINPKPLISHTWKSYTNDGPKMRVTINNDGTGTAYNCEVYVAFDAGNNMVYNPQTFKYFNLTAQENYVCVFHLDYPRNVHTRFIVRIISGGVLMIESHSEWFDLK
jgi:hypothetical protein